MQQYENSMTKREPTNFALVLGLALTEKNIEHSLEHWDGHKHVDIYISEHIPEIADAIEKVVKNL